MEITTCSARSVLVPCTLPNLAYQIDPYVGCQHRCHYCYVLNQAETDWRHEIQIHADIIGQLTAKLTEIPPQPIYMGWCTDPYQPCEANCNQTRRVLELLSERGFTVSLLTKSDLVLRDIDLLQQMENASVSISVAFNEDITRRHFEANTIPNQARINALSTLRQAGIRTSAMICPVIPYITRVPPLIEELAPFTDVIWIYGLSIREPSEPNWHNLQAILGRHFKDLQAPIEAAIFSKEHPYWINLRQALERLRRDKQLNLNIHI